MPSLPTVLIVDDQASSASVVQALLQHEGYNLALAANGPDALSMACALLPDLVLLDIMMPGMDGYEVCRRLRSFKSLELVPVVMVTALDDRESRLKAIECGADDFLTKPVDAVELRSRVRCVTRLNRQRRLLAEQARFHSVVERADSGYLLLDGTDIVYANSSAIALFDLPATAPWGDFLEAAHRTYRAEPAEVWTAWGAGQAAQDVALYLVRSETSAAHAAWLQVEDVPLTVDDHGRRMISVRNISDLKGLERDRWSFRRALSHKLRTPLSGLLGSLDLLATEARSLLPADLVTLVGVANESARRLESAVNGMLAYVDVRRGSRLPDPTPVVGVGAIVADLSAELGLDAIQVRMDSSLDEEWIALASADVERILLEVLENSRKFHPAGRPTIVVAVGRSADGRVRISVQDDGTSVPDAHLARVWAPYYQVEPAFTGEVPGMGLGLSAVAGIVWSVQGSCRMSNRMPGPGVVVDLDLPLSSTPART